MPHKKWWSRKSKSFPEYKKSLNRQQKCKQWNEAQKLSAIETATSGVLANQAARQHGVSPVSSTAVETSSSSCMQESHEMSVVAKF